MKRVIFFVENFFCERDYERFGVATLQRRGIVVEVWDFTSYLRPHIPSSVLPNRFRFGGLEIVDSKGITEVLLSTLTGREIVVSLIAYSLENMRAIYSRLPTRNVHLGVVMLGVIFPEAADEAGEGRSKGRFTGTSQNFQRAALFVKELIRPRDLVRNVLRRILLLRSKIPDFILISGVRAINYNPYPMKPSTDIVWCHALDYDLYLQAEESASTENEWGKYAVFLDMFLPFHPDYELLGLDLDCTVEEYYPRLVKFFGHIEGETGYEVIIAAHPRSEYERLPDFFEGRKVIRGETLRLVKNSILVLTHSSSALSFAVLYSKPVIFLTQDSYSDWFRSQIDGLAYSLGQKPINLSESYPVNLTAELTVNEESYSNYIEAFIKKPGSPEKNTWEIFADYCLAVDQ